MAEPVPAPEMRAHIQSALDRLLELSQDFAYIAECLHRATALKMLVEERDWAFESAYRSNSNFRFATDLAETIHQLQTDMQNKI